MPRRDYEIFVPDKYHGDESGDARAAAVEAVNSFSDRIEGVTTTPEVPELDEWRMTIQLPESEIGENRKRLEEALEDVAEDIFRHFLQNPDRGSIGEFVDQKLAEHAGLQQQIAETDPSSVLIIDDADYVPDAIGRKVRRMNRKNGYKYRCEWVNPEHDLPHIDQLQDWLREKVANALPVHAIFLDQNIGSVPTDDPEEKASVKGHLVFQHLLEIDSDLARSRCTTFSGDDAIDIRETYLENGVELPPGGLEKGDTNTDRFQRFFDAVPLPIEPGRSNFALDHITEDEIRRHKEKKEREMREWRERHGFATADEPTETVVESATDPNPDGEVEQEEVAEEMPTLRLLTDDRRRLLNRVFLTSAALGVVCGVMSLAHVMRKSSSTSAITEYLATGEIENSKDLPLTVNENDVASIHSEFGSDPEFQGLVEDLQAGIPPSLLSEEKHALYKRICDRYQIFGFAPYLLAVALITYIGSIGTYGAMKGVDSIAGSRQELESEVPVA